MTLLTIILVALVLAYPLVRTKLFVYDDDFLRKIIISNPRRINEVLLRPSTRFFKNKTTGKLLNYAILNVDPDILTDIQPFITKYGADLDTALLDAVRCNNVSAVEWLIAANASTSSAYELLGTGVAAQKIADILIKYAPKSETKKWFLANYGKITAEQHRIILNTMFTDEELHYNLPSIIKALRLRGRKDLLDLSRTYVRQFYERRLETIGDLILLLAENKVEEIIGIHIDMIEEFGIIPKVLSYFSVDTLNKPDTSGDTPVIRAVRRKNFKYALALLDVEGIDIKAKGTSGNTILHYPFIEIQKKVLSIASFEDLNAKNAYGLTPLHLAGLYGCKDSARLLLGSGADVSIKDNQGRTVTDITGILNGMSV